MPLQRTNLARLGAFALMRARYMALDIAGRAGHSGYTRFLILGKARSGTHLITRALAEHPGAVVYGEVFRDPDRIHGEAWPHFRARLLRSRRTRSLYTSDPVGFLETMIYGRHPLAISAVGFKLLYYQAQEEERRCLWTYLSGHKEVRILHVQRRNTLRQYLSLKRALESDRWINVTGTKESAEPIHLGVEACRRAFEYARLTRETHDKLFKEHPKLDVAYEDLTDDFVAQMNRIQAFIGLAPEPLTPRTVQQATSSLSETILNYEELRSGFIGTPWEWFFED